MTYEEAKVIVKEHTKGLVAKWEKTGLLDGLNKTVEDRDWPILVESKPVQYRDDDPNFDPEKKLFHEAMSIIYEHEKKI